MNARTTSRLFNLSLAAAAGLSLAACNEASEPSDDTQDGAIEGVAEGDPVSQGELEEAVPGAPDVDLEENPNTSEAAGERDPGESTESDMPASEAPDSSD